MYPYIRICDEKVSIYSVCVLLGAGVSLLLLTKLLRRKQLLCTYMPLFAISLFGLLLGAKLFGVLSKGIVNLVEVGRFDLYDSLFNSGVVYWGGLLGMLVALQITCHFRKREFGEISDILGVIIPLFHAFGRLGCYFVGCCYGCEYTGILALPYRIGWEGEWLLRFPTQLAEVVLELLLFAIHFLLYFHARQHGKTSLLFRYLLIYSIFRFVIEFYRGDTVRGVFHGISFSQIVCITVLGCLAVYYKKHRRKCG